jgi:hypothetical protein
MKKSTGVTSAVGSIMIEYRVSYYFLRILSQVLDEIRGYDTFDDAIRDAKKTVREHHSAQAVVAGEGRVKVQKQ